MDNKDSCKLNTQSIYYELKKFHDVNPKEIYSYQDLKTAGINEFKIVFNKENNLKDYQRNRLSCDLIEMLQESLNNEKISRYLISNPIINYYENFIKYLKVLINNDKDIAEQLSVYIKNILLNSSSSEEIKFGLISATVLKIEGIEDILDLYSIHNDYNFYVIKSYECMKDGNSLIFKLAKKSKGYGKVFSVKALQPINYDIKSWMINYGSQNNVAVTQLLMYSMISLNLLEYLEESDFDENNIEVFSKSFCMLLSDYGIEYISDAQEVYERLIDIIDEKGKGIYSLYAVISILYSIEYKIEYYNSQKESESNLFYEKYKETVERCNNIFKKTMWKEVVVNQISNIDVESSVLISCSDKIGYKLNKNEFELLLKREYSNPLLYKYAFSVGNRYIKKSAFKLGMKYLPMTELFKGQDGLKIEDLIYEDVAHICFFIIIKYITYEQIPKEYKKINLDALRSPLIETRMQAIVNLEGIKDELDSLDREIIKDAISSEMITEIRIRLNLLLSNNQVKQKQYIEVKDLSITPHVKDVYLISFQVAGTKYVDMKEVDNKLFEEDIVYLKRDINNAYDENAIYILNEDGYILGYVPRENNLILKNLLDNGKYLYGIVKKISDYYEDITIDVYLSYTDIIEEIKNTLLLLSKGKEDYVQ